MERYTREDLALIGTTVCEKAVTWYKLQRILYVELSGLVNCII